MSLGSFSVEMKWLLSNNHFNLRSSLALSTLSRKDTEITGIFYLDGYGICLYTGFNDEENGFHLVKEKQDSILYSQHNLKV